MRPLGVIIHHAMPNAAVPLLMFLGIEIGGILAGSAVTETIFAWPGLGRLLVDAVATRDLAVDSGFHSHHYADHGLCQPAGRYTSHPD